VPPDARPPAGPGGPDPADVRGGAGSAPLRAEEVTAVLLAPGGPLARCAVVPRAGSTSTDLLALLAADPAWADGGLLVAEHQEAGRGRTGRTWTTPPGTALTFSLALRPGVPREGWGWLPLLAGLGVVRAVRAATGLGAVLKWPNDVLVPAADGADLPGWGTDRKVAGLLAEVAPGTAPGAVVLGVGVNVAQGAADLPVPSATSLAAAGAGPGALDRTTLLVAVVHEVLDLVGRWRAHGGDAAAAGLDAQVAAACRTLGAQVRATVPGGDEVRGTAVRIAPDGALVLRGADGTEHPLLAGDVRHVRPDGELGSSA
jgi:BirA family biotin operon repressor/biotin-[acetyl-CoA-carboxylase] ligase